MCTRKTSPPPNEKLPKFTNSLPIITFITLRVFNNLSPEDFVLHQPEVDDLEITLVILLNSGTSMIPVIEPPIFGMQF